ncbi:SMN family protein Yip12 [Schizosaccharomyces cryophilus OY26]|uniref:SMN family protein Yip12 n=1 Tax=Schizosaccharomyces cryophilus (strain OY26 / ATCC MYA-4695 / CBS 11777 / NBRC 106824 / NRRL Y48691) TaxID=653667 RepID=S9VXH7_SCHCR|nr:SMN family protein Yip12 [Schizosaccharomyces cryophilus OY26]EPY50884.1 SMN family protein Yip12 [Schizosaccharomyces cryophilus OY26]
MAMKRKRVFHKSQATAPLDDETNQRCAFPEIIENQVDSQDIGIPLDGLDYLAAVRKEAQSLNSFKSAGIKLEKPESIPHKPLYTDPTHSVCSQEPLLKDLYHIVEEKNKKLTTYPLDLLLDNSTLPSTLQQWRHTIANKIPSWPIIASTDLATILDIFENCAYWLENDSLDVQSQWLFCFCCKLPDILNGEDISTLRSALRSLRSTHTTFPSIQTSASTLNAVLVFRYGQNDLL